MQHEKGQIIKTLIFRLFSPVILSFFIWVTVQFFYQLTSPISVLLNIIGTLLIAFAISFPQGPNRLKWWLFDSMMCGATPSFSYLNFYLGLTALIVGITVGGIK